MTDHQGGGLLQLHVLLARHHGACGAALDRVARLARAGQHADREVAVRDDPHGPVASSASTTEPTLRSRISSATWRTGVFGDAVTTDEVMISRSSTARPRSTVGRDVRRGRLAIPERPRRVVLVVLGLHDARQPVARRKHHGERRGHQADQRLDTLACTRLGGRQRCHGPPILRSGIRLDGPARAPRTVPIHVARRACPGASFRPFRRRGGGGRRDRAVRGRVLVAVDLFRRPDNNKPAELRYLDRHSGELLGSAIVQAVGMLLLALVALHLYRATRARRPEEPFVVAVMAVYGPVALALVTVTRAVALGVIAGDFSGQSTQTLKAADEAFDDPALLIPQYVGISAVLALAFWLVKGSLDAMRVGLLNRFMGIVGIALGPAFVLGFGSLILPVWLIALGACSRDSGRAHCHPHGNRERRCPGPARRNARNRSPPPPRPPRPRSRAATARSTPLAGVCAGPAGGAAGEAADRLAPMGAPRACLAAGLALVPGAWPRVGTQSSTPTGPRRRSGAGSPARPA